MFFGQDISQIAFVFMVAIAVGGMALAVFFPLFASASASKRIQAVTSTSKTPARQTLRSRLMEDPKDTRRKQIQDSLNQQRENSARKTISPSSPRPALIFQSCSDDFGDRGNCHGHCAVCFTCPVCCVGSGVVGFWDAVVYRFRPEAERLSQ
jgi:Flp pilus assembly protein TadB